MMVFVYCWYYCLYRAVKPSVQPHPQPPEKSGQALSEGEGSLPPLRLLSFFVVVMIIA